MKTVLYITFFTFLTINVYAGWRTSLSCALDRKKDRVQDINREIQELKNVHERMYHYGESSSKGAFVALLEFINATEDALDSFEKGVLCLKNSGDFEQNQQMLRESYQAMEDILITIRGVELNTTKRFQKYALRVTSNHRRNYVRFTELADNIGTHSQIRGIRIEEEGTAEQ